MPEEPPAAAPVGEAERAKKLAALIERWFADNFHGSPVARDTQVFNHVRRAVDKLPALLAKTIRG